MKNNTRTLYFLALLFLSSNAFSQKYKTIEDTTKLNKEYVNVSNDLAELNAKLTIAQNDLPGYIKKANDANTDAAMAASASSNQADKATNGTMADAKKAKRRANKAYSEAKDSKSAKNKVDSQQDKITRYQLDIAKKQQRLDELNVIRVAINPKMQTDSIPKL